MSCIPESSPMLATFPYPKVAVVVLCHYLSKTEGFLKAASPENNANSQLSQRFGELRATIAYKEPYAVRGDTLSRCEC